MTKYIWQEENWPHFTYDKKELYPLLETFFYNYGVLEGLFNRLTPYDKEILISENLTKEISYSYKIDNVIIDSISIQKSFIKALSFSLPLPEEDINDELNSITKTFLDNLSLKTITKDTLFEIKNGFKKVGDYNEDKEDFYRKEHSYILNEEGYVLFDSPNYESINKEMDGFFKFFNDSLKNDPIELVIKSAITCLYFIAIHPLGDENNIIARYLSLLPLTHLKTGIKYPAFYLFSISESLFNNRRSFIETLEKSLKTGLNITSWISWYLKLLNTSVLLTGEKLTTAIKKKAFWQHVSTLPIKLNDRQKNMLNILIEGSYKTLSKNIYISINECTSEEAQTELSQLELLGLLHYKDGLYTLNQ